MEVMEHVIHGAILLELRGELDFSSRQSFMNAIHDANKNGYSHVIVNLEGVTCADDAAIGMLVIAHQKLIHQHRRLSLLKPSGSLEHQLHSMKFPRIIPIYATLEEALRRKTLPLTLVD